MDAAGMRAFSVMDIEERLHLAEDAIKWAGLVAGGSDRISVHRITRPDHLSTFLLHSSYQLRQMIADLLGTKARDERQTARFIFRVQKVNQLQQSVRGQRRTALQA